MMGKAIMLVGSARRSDCLVSTSGIAAMRRNKSATELSDCQYLFHIRPDSKCLHAARSQALASVVVSRTLSRWYWRHPTCHLGDISSALAVVLAMVLAAMDVSDIVGMIYHKVGFGHMSRT
jgi:hypothetical protein